MADVRETTTGLHLNRTAKGDVRTQVEKLTLQPIYSTNKVGNISINQGFHKLDEIGNNANNCIRGFTT